jgi:hypothetical protein
MFLIEIWLAFVFIVHPKSGSAFQQQFEEELLESAL